MTVETIPIENSGQVGVLAISGLCIFIPSLLVALRFVAKKRARGRLDGSDFCILAALVFNSAMQIDLWIMVFRGGFGFHAVDIATRFGPATLTVFYKCLFAFPLLWNATIPFSKISVLLMYVMIIPVGRMFLAVRMIGGVIVVWNIASFLAGLFMCWPIAYNWDQTVSGGRCGSQPNYYFALGIINLVTDFVIIGLPMPFLYKLLLPRSKRLLAMGMFSIGFFTVAITIYRQAILPSMDFEDMTFSGVHATLFSGIEPAVAIAVACVPLLRPLFRGSGSQGGNTGYSGGTGSRKTDSQTTASRLRRKRTLRAHSSSNNFPELDDDSSEIQLRPFNVKQDVTVTAEGSEQDSQPGFITVEKKWEVRSEDEEEAEARLGTAARQNMPVPSASSS